MDVADGQPLDTLELAAALHPRLVRLHMMLWRDSQDLGLSRTALSVLALLREHGSLRITELAVAEHVAQPSMTALIDRLQRRGWVARDEDPDDRRAVLVALSPEGGRVLDRLVGERVAALRERLGALSAGDREAVAAALPGLDRLIDGAGTR